MSDIDDQLDTLEILREAELLILQGNYPELAAAPIEGHEAIWQEYTDEASDIELYYARAKHDLQIAHSKTVHQSELTQYKLMNERQRDWLHLPRFTLWDIVLGLLGK